jgi:hypothetical protein
MLPCLKPYPTAMSFLRVPAQDTCWLPPVRYNSNQARTLPVTPSDWRSCSAATVSKAVDRSKAMMPTTCPLSAPVSHLACACANADVHDLLGRKPYWAPGRPSTLARCLSRSVLTEVSRTLDIAGRIDTGR